MSEAGGESATPGLLIPLEKWLAATVIEGEVVANEIESAQAMCAAAWDVGYEAGSKWDSGDNPYRTSK